MTIEERARNLTHRVRSSCLTSDAILSAKKALQAQRDDMREMAAKLADKYDDLIAAKLLAKEIRDLK